jgi:hypothetical protein
MNTIAEKTPQAPVFDKTMMDEYFRSPEGQQALRQSRLPQQTKPRSPMSEADQDKFCKMAEKTDIHYIRIDPETKKPLTEEKGEETFWRIMNVIPQAVGNNEAEIRINFYLIRFMKNKTYQRAISPTNSTQVTEYEPYTIRKTGRFSGLYELVETGDRICDAEDFVKQYKRDEE